MLIKALREGNTYVLQVAQYQPSITGFFLEQVWLIQQKTNDPSKIIYIPDWSVGWRISVRDRNLLHNRQQSAQRGTCISLPDQVNDKLKQTSFLYLERLILTL